MPQPEMIHPSLTALFIDPPPLEPQQKMAVNSPCWCLSGRKWKNCHRLREFEKALPFSQLLAENNSGLAKGECLHPEANRESCNKLIKAHTVQRSGGLSVIAEDSHVMSVKAALLDIGKNEGALVPRRVGIHGASTFAGFCGDHDDQLFAPVEKAPITISREACFLLSYRAICYEYLMKRNSVENSDRQRDLLDRGRPFEIQTVVQDHLYYTRMGQSRGLHDVTLWKATYDSAYLAKSYGDFIFCAVQFDGALPVVACGAIHPDFDVFGNRLQMISRGSAPFEHLSINITGVRGKTLLVLGSVGQADGPAEQYMKSFMNLPVGEMANVAMHVAFEYLENIYFRESWWNALDEKVRIFLDKRIRSGLGPLGGTTRTSKSVANYQRVLANAAVVVRAHIPRDSMVNHLNQSRV